MIGSCDCCDRQKVPVIHGFVTGIETFQCYLCQGETDPDPHSELEELAAFERLVEKLEVQR